MTPRRPLLASSWTSFAFFLILLLLAGCGGGPTTTLKTVGTPKGDGPVQFYLENKTDVAVNSLYLAETAAVNKTDWRHAPPGSPGEQELWGSDLLSAALPSGQKRQISGVAPGQWDVRVTDRDGREQHVAGVKLAAGGHYVLILGEGGWRVRN